MKNKLYPHNDSCICFRCSGVPWNKGKKTGLIPRSAFKRGEGGYWKGKKRPNLLLDHFYKKGLVSMENHPRWKGGRQKTVKGYIHILKPDHPYADNKGRIFEHRLVMENILGRYLLPTEVVHHKNKITNDNRPENLKLFSSNGEHLRYELKGKNIKNK